MNNQYYDLTCERIVIGALLQYGNTALSHIDDIIDKSDFFDTKNQCIYACLKYVIEETDTPSVTVDAVLTTAKILNLTEIISKEDIEFLKLCKQQLVNLAELSQYIKQIKFWNLTRNLSSKCKNISSYLTTLTGKETISEIISKAEEEIFGFIPDIISDDNNIINISEFTKQYAEFLANHPVDIAGLPTGFPKYDAIIGGGYRRGTVNVIGARSGVGKSFICLNIAKHLVEQGVPVLYLDTELNKEIQSSRWLALISKLDINIIETGKFKQNQHHNHRIDEALENTKGYPFYHINIAGKSIDECKSLIRRWIHRYVNKDENGQTNDCLIILDYLKTMDLKDLGHFSEHQYLGDFMTKLHNFAVKHSLPILTTVQLNRDGISKDSSDIISGSDRIYWLCSSLAILKPKTPEDIAAGDVKTHGELKLIVIKSRFGPGMNETNEYINIKSNLSQSLLVEGKYNYEVLEGMDLLSDDDDENITI